VVSFTTQPLHTEGKSLWYPLDRRLGGAQNQSGHGGEENNSQPLPGLEPQIIKTVAQCFTIELSWLLINVTYAVENYIMKYIVICTVHPILLG
jgi:hypothetical protein